MPDEAIADRDLVTIEIDDNTSISAVITDTDRVTYWVDYWIGDEEKCIGIGLEDFLALMKAIVLLRNQR